MGDNKVIHLDSIKFGPWLKREHIAVECTHHNVGVCFSARVVRCRDCDADLDPILILDQLATGERKLYHTVKAIQRSELLLKDLKREERRIKERIQRGKRKLEDKDV